MAGTTDHNHLSVSGKGVESGGKIPEWNVTGTGSVASRPFVELAHIEEHGATSLEFIRLVGSDTVWSARQLR